MAFAYVLVWGWTADPYEHWFFNQPGEALLLLTHYAKIFKWGSMTCGVTVVMNWGVGLQIFLEPLSECSRCFFNVCLITFQPVTFKSVDYATLFCYVVFIFRCNRFIFQGLFTLELYLYAISFTYVLEALT